MGKCFTAWVEKTYKKKKSSDLKQIYCFGPCRVLPDFCKMCSAMTMVNCLSIPMSLRQLLHLLKRFNLPSWQNIILVSRSPGSFWELTAVGAVVLCEGQPKGRSCFSEDPARCGLFAGDGDITHVHSPAPAKSQCFFVKVEVNSPAWSAWGLGPDGIFLVDPDEPEACMGKCQRWDTSLVVPAWSLMQYVVRWCH